MIAVFQKELNSYFKGMMGYLFTAFVLLFAGIYTMAYNLSGYYANFEYVLDAISFIYLIAVPIITMRSVAEEKRSKTDQLLYSLPISLTNVIVGKYLAIVAVLLVPTAILATYPLILSQFGAVQLSTAYSALIGFFLLGACLLSIGLFISSVTESQVTAAVVTLVAMLLLFFGSSLSSFVSTDATASLTILCVLMVLFALLVQVLTRNPIVSVGVGAVGIGSLMVWYQVDFSAFAGLFGDIITYLSVFDRYTTFVEGVFDVTAVVYYLSVICVMLFLSVQALEKRRWSE